MTMNGNDKLLLKEDVVNAYKDYKTLAMVKENVADEQTGRQIYLDSNHKIMWLEMAEDSDYQILIEMEK